MELAVVPLYTVRTARPRLVRVPRTYSAWGAGASCPAPLVRTARRRLAGWYARTQLYSSPYVQYGGRGTTLCGRVSGSGRGLTAAGSCRR